MRNCCEHGHHPEADVPIRIYGESGSLSCPECKWGIDYYPGRNTVTQLHLPNCTLWAAICLDHGVDPALTDGVNVG